MEAVDPSIPKSQPPHSAGRKGITFFDDPEYKLRKHSGCSLRATESKAARRSAPESSLRSDLKRTIFHSPRPRKMSSVSGNHIMIYDAIIAGPINYTAQRGRCLVIVAIRQWLIWTPNFLVWALFQTVWHRNVKFDTLALFCYFHLCLTIAVRTCFQHIFDG